jgi:ribosomal protein L11 methyltransferase
MMSEKEEWLEVVINHDPLIRESLCSYMFELGAHGVIEPLREDDPLISYFSPESDIAKLRLGIQDFIKKLLNLFPGLKEPEIRFSRIAWKDWSEEWKRFFHADKITENLMIVPPWERVPSGFDAHVIIINPGPAFGTGKHPTTRMCLMEMERLIRGRTYKMLDVGTGSGILAIYGAMLGVASILAIDIDEDAIRWARKNSILNGVQDRINFVLSSPESIRGKFHTITANLTLEIIIQVIQDLLRLLAPDGYLLISGIISDQRHQIERLIHQHRLDIDRVTHQDEWLCFVLKILMR